MSSPKSHKGLRRLFIAAVAVLWLAVAGVGLEVYSAYRLRHAEAEADAFCEPRMKAAYEADQQIIEATRASAPPPPSHLVQNPPPRERFAEADEAGRQELAEARQEIILLCDTDGTIRSRYAVSEPEDLARLGAKAESGSLLMDLLPEAEAEDARQALPQAASADFYPPREYGLPQPGGTAFRCEFAFVPLPEAQVAVFIRPSMWEEPWLKFRGNMYAENFYDRWPGSTFWTNERGFRDDPVVMPKPEGVYRIACVGGSTTVEGPRNDLTYPNMLEALLREHFDTGRIEVVNCGVYTLDTGRELKLFPEYLAMDPDLVVQYNFVNDAAALVPGWLKPESFAKDPAKSVKAVLRHSRFVHRHFNAWLLPQATVMRGYISDTIINNLRGMHGQASAEGVRIAFCSFAYPDVDALDRREADYFYFRSNRLWGWSVETSSYVELVKIYNGLVEDLCRENGAIYAPVAENVRGGVDQFTDICHMHLGAMEAKAQAIFNAIRETVAQGLEGGNPS